MDLRIFAEPQQGATYETQLAVAQEAERLGFSAFFRSDHYLKMGGVSGLPGPTDSWVTLGAIARETSTIRLGTLVTSATFRHPGPLAIQVAQVDRMSGGRVDFGLGAGWYQAEHDAYAIPFPGTVERFDRFEEQLEIVTGLWAATAESPFSYTGEHYSVTDSPGLPKPVQTTGHRGGPPIVVGGKGPKRTPDLAARFADEFNVPFDGFDVTGRQIARVKEAAERHGRAGDDLVYSVAQVLCVGRDEAEVSRRAAAIGREPAELRENGVAGTPAEAIEKLGRFAELGIGRVYLQVLDLADLDHLGLVAGEIVPALASR